MSKIRISYDPEAIKQVNALNGLKGKNLVANEVYAHEEWLDSEQNGNNFTDHDVSGTEFLNFAKHIDTDGDNKITDTEIEQWRSSNNSVGNTAHKGFSEEEVMELFDMVITQANNKTGKNSGYVYPDENSGSGTALASGGNKFGTDYITYFNENGFNYDQSSGSAWGEQRYGEWFDRVDDEWINSMRSKAGLSSNSSEQRASDTEDAKSKKINYNEIPLSSADDDVVDKTMKQLRGTNFVVQNIYAHEEWLDDNKYDGKATNKKVNQKISGEELASFASHIDQNNDGTITYEEFKQWREDNISAGNAAHANFTYQQVQEIFDAVKKGIK